jgi:hypothetical protein
LTTLAIVFSVSINGIVTDSYAQQTQQNKGKVFVMYAASLIKTFEQTLGPSFEKKTGYAYTGEGRGSLQIANITCKLCNAKFDSLGDMQRHVLTEHMQKGDYQIHLESTNVDSRVFGFTIQLIKISNQI